ncbi:MAG: hypothetical protein AAFP90_22975, partial [Planctomycetota bacterium]
MMRNVNRCCQNPTNESVLGIGLRRLNGQNQLERTHQRSAIDADAGVAAAFTCRTPAGATIGQG